MSRRSFQEECLREELISRAPRYFEGRLEAFKPNIVVIFVWVIRGVLEKKTIIFLGLRAILEAFEKVDRISQKFLASWKEGCPMRRLLSTNC